jgi:hypothetical protein
MLPRTILKLLLTLAALLFFVDEAAVAQSPLTPCATVTVSGLSEVEPGTMLVFDARMTGPIHTTKPEFKWTVSAGTIKSGQGTEVIVVDTVGLGGQEVTATAELTGASPGCKASASSTTKVKPPIVCNFPFDQYGDIEFEDEKARLDNFAIQIANEPLATGQIIMFAGRETFRNEAAERLARAKSYLMDVRQIDRNRIITTDCGFSEALRITLLVVPAGASALTCDTYSAIPFSEVKFTKPHPKSPKKRL